MKKLFIIGNWKSNKTKQEAHDWLKEIRDFNLPRFEGKEIIFCPSFTVLPFLQQWIENEHIPLELGSQDISAFESGAHTGEVNAQQVKEFASYAIIGHSERRMELFETDELIAKKVAQAKQYSITPILCVQGPDTPIPDGVTLVAYEPVSAIGTGHADTPEDAESVAKTIKEKNPNVEYILYGGSVTGDNVRSFTELPSIHGVLVGGASLDPEKFRSIIQNA